MSRFLPVACLLAALSLAPAHAAAHVVSASGPLAVLNGAGAVDLQAVAPPQGVPAPAGTLTLTLWSTFDPTNPKVVAVGLLCTAVAGGQFYGSGTDATGTTWYVHLAPPSPYDTLPLWLLGWSTQSSSGPCGAGVQASVPIIGPAQIVSAPA